MPSDLRTTLNALLHDDVARVALAALVANAAEANVPVELDEARAIREGHDVEAELLHGAALRLMGVAVPSEH